MHPNTMKRAMLVKKIVDEHYEPGNQARCLKAVWRHYVCKVYPCSLATYYRYMDLATAIDGYIGTGGNREAKYKPMPKDARGSPIQLELGI